MASAAVDSETRGNYLNVDYSLKSWLLTTDHKRIALLYLASITLFFFVGGFAATLMRLNLIEPNGALVEPATYNKLFSAHGIIMVFFFMIPSSCVDPAALLSPRCNANKALTTSQYS